MASRMKRESVTNSLSNASARQLDSHDVFVFSELPDERDVEIKTV